jgi:hypothetical protein
MADPREVTQGLTPNPLECGIGLGILHQHYSALAE